MDFLRRLLCACNRFHRRKSRQAWLRAQEAVTPRMNTATETAAPAAQLSAPPVRPASAAPSPLRIPPAKAPTADPEKREKTLRALADLHHIPALQSLARQFTSTLMRDEVSVTDVVQAIEKDSALCVRVLRLANSAAIGSEQEIEDLDTAVQMLGVARVRKTAQTIFTLRDAHHVVPGVDWKHLWVHALGTAALAEELARRVGVPADTRVFESGLLHDVGKLVLATVDTDIFRAVLAEAWAGRGGIEDLERAAFGVTHREAGQLFARHNQLPERIVQVIAHHDDPAAAESERLVVALVHVANYLSKRHGIGFSGSRLTDADGEWADLGAWEVIRAEGGWVPDLDDLEAELATCAERVRADLRGLQETIGTRSGLTRPPLPQPTAA